MEIRPILSALLRNKTAPLLVAIQVAISLAILVNALYVVNLRLASAVRPSGVANEEDVFYVTTSPVPKRSHQDILAQQRIDADALKGIPGVTSVAWTNQMPMSRSGSNSGFALDRKQQKVSAVLATYYSPDSLTKTLGLKMVDGRDFNNSDIVELDWDLDDGNKKFPKGVIITKPLADFLYPNQGSAVGKTLLYGLGDDAAETRVIGVVERLQTTGASVRPTGEYSVIIPWRVSTQYSRFVVRAEPGQRDRAMADAEAALRKAAAVPTIVRTRTVETDRTNRYRNEKAMANMLIAVCVLLLLVTASGIVGMTMLRVAQRKKLIGVRRALGARKRDILMHFITENFIIVTGGVFGGVLMALFLNQLLVSQLELPKLPMGYLVWGVGVLWVLGVAAVYGPAWRAAGISPALATRSA